MSVFDEVTAEARKNSSMSDAEFDYSLFTDGRAVMELAYATFSLANKDFPAPKDDLEAQEYRERGYALHREIWPRIEELIAQAGAKKYIGHADGPGGVIRYADDTPPEAQIYERN